MKEFREILDIGAEDLENPPEFSELRDANIDALKMLDYYIFIRKSDLPDGLHEAVGTWCEYGDLDANEQRIVAEAATLIAEGDTP